MEDRQPNEVKPQIEPVLSLRTRGRRAPDFDALSKEDIERLERRNKDPQRLLEIENVVQKLLALEEQNGGTLRGTSARKAAAKRLGFSVWTIDNYMARYKADPRIESLIDKKRGRTPGGTFSDLQQAIICFFYINPEKQITDDDKNTTVIKGLADARYILGVLRMFTPDISHSENAVRNFMRKLNKDDPLVVALARQGKTYIESKILPARRNDPKLPNDRWQIDGRPLPIYIKHDGLICTVTLLLIIDDFSQYPIRARLIPRQLRDEKGIPKRTDFSAADVGILFASAIHYSRTCCGTLYNDHGSQLIAIAEFLNDLSEENQAVVRMAMSIPRRPRGRGKIENMLKKFDELLKDLIANLVGKESDFDAIRDARTRPDHLSLEELQQKCDDFMEQLRDSPRRQGEKKTRRELWEQPEGIRKAPPIRRLMMLVPEKVSRPTAIDYWKFQFDKQEHEPRLKSEEDLYRWMVAAARKEFVQLRAANLDQGWEIDICLDREDGYWCEGVLKTEQYLTKEQYAPMLGRVLARAKRQHADKLEALREIMEMIGVDKVHKHEITKQPVIIKPDNDQETSPAKDSNPPEQNPPAPPNDQQNSLSNQAKLPSSVSVRTAPPRKPDAPVGRKFDWSKAPKAQDVGARVERELQQKKDNT